MLYCKFSDSKFTGLNSLEGSVVNDMQQPIALKVVVEISNCNNTDLLQHKPKHSSRTYTHIYKQTDC